MTPRRALALLLLAAAPAAAQDGEAAAADSDTVAVAVIVPQRPPTRYGIVRSHLPDSPAAPQLAVALTRYVANFGSRDGVMPGSTFDVYRGPTFLGMMRVEDVYRDSSSLRLISLDRKLDPQATTPVIRGDLLYPRRVLLESIEFGSGKPDFSGGMSERLRYASRFILSFPDFAVHLEGHTDNVGPKADNQTLSRQRAETVAGYLHDIQRIPREQMVAVGFGDAHPLVDNGSEAGRYRNRRVDVVMVSEPSPGTAPAAVPPPEAARPAAPSPSR